MLNVAIYLATIGTIAAIALGIFVYVSHQNKPHYNS